MTATDTSAVVEQIDSGATQQALQSALPSETPDITICGSYKEAKHLAATGRRSGNVETRHVRAVYLISRQTWCVK